MTFYVDVDMVLDETRSKQGHLSVQGSTRKKLEEYGLTSKVLRERGPGGGNPLVRLYGSRRALLKYLDEVYQDDDGVYADEIVKVEGRSPG